MQPTTVVPIYVPQNSGLVHRVSTGAPDQTKKRLIKNCLPSVQSDNTAFQTPKQARNLRDYCQFPLQSSENMLTRLPNK